MSGILCVSKKHSSHLFGLLGNEFEILHLLAEIDYDGALVETKVLEANE